MLSRRDSHQFAIALAFLTLPAVATAAEPACETRAACVTTYSEAAWAQRSMRLFVRLSSDAASARYGFRDGTRIYQGSRSRPCPCLPDQDHAAGAMKRLLVAAMTLDRENAAPMLSADFEFVAAEPRPGATVRRLDRERLLALCAFDSRGIGPEGMNAPGFLARFGTDFDVRVLSATRRQLRLHDVRALFRDGWGMAARRYRTAWVFEVVRGDDPQFADGAHDPGRWYVRRWYESTAFADPAFTATAFEARLDRGPLRPMAAIAGSDPAAPGAAAEVR